MTKVLIIEDDMALLNPMKAIFARAGYNVFAASNGKEAIEKIESDQFDVVITDLLIPFANGFEIIGRLKNNVSGKVPLIIVVSNVGNKETADDVLALGADEFMRKPIAVNELLVRINTLLAARESEVGV